MQDIYLHNVSGQEFDLSGRRNLYPQWQMHDPHSEPFFKDTGRRRALCIGINYSLHTVPGFRLKKCIEDAHTMANFLYTNFGFEPCDIRIITDRNPRDHAATARNILEAMVEFVRGAQPNDSLFFYFSGHALQVNDRSGNKVNCICATDYHGDPYLGSPGLISNSLMHQLMVDPLPRECRLTALFDSCHSGGLLGLPHLYDSIHWNGSVNPLRHPEYSGILHYADVVSLSASKDEQEAIETEQGGALLWAFMESVEKYGNALTYQELLWSVRDYMKRHGLSQRPQLSSSREIDIWSWLKT